MAGWDICVRLHRLVESWVELALSSSAIGTVRREEYNRTVTVQVVHPSANVTNRQILYLETLTTSNEASQNKIARTDPISVCGLGDREILGRMQVDKGCSVSSVWSEGCHKLRSLFDVLAPIR